MCQPWTIYSFFDVGKHGNGGKHGKLWKTGKRWKIVENMENDGKHGKLWRTWKTVENAGKHGKRGKHEKYYNLDVFESDIFDHFTKLFQLKYSNFCMSKDCTAYK